MEWVPLYRYWLTVSPSFEIYRYFDSALFRYVLKLASLYEKCILNLQTLVTVQKLNVIVISSYHSFDHNSRYENSEISDWRLNKKHDFAVYSSTKEVYHLSSCCIWNVFSYSRRRNGFTYFTDFNTCHVYKKKWIIKHIWKAIKHQMFCLCRNSTIYCLQKTQKK